MPQSSTPRISILVPIYNVESYLSTCLESLINQTLKDLEIICINDGSTDKSLDIIKSYQTKDSRIKLINKPNTGYGDSMNQGLRKAQGAYIGIVEPDDYIELNAFKFMLHFAESLKLDVLRTNYYTHIDGKADVKTHFLVPQIPDSELPLNQVIRPRDYPAVFYQPPAIWSAIYRREFLIENQIEFLPTPGASYQDTGFNFKVWAMARRGFFCTEAFLHYRLDNASSSVKDPKKANFVNQEYTSITEYLQKHQYFAQLAPIMQATKFDAYAWNLYRLDQKSLPDFLMTMRAEFTAAKKQNLLDPTYFEPAKWQLLQSILNQKISTSMRKIKFIKHKQALRQKLKTLILKLRPTYRRQRQIADLIQEIENSQKLLQTELNLREKGEHA